MQRTGFICKCLDAIARTIQNGAAGTALERQDDEHVLRREISMETRYLFKGKRIDNGDWVQGVPFEIEGKTVILIKDNENLLRTHYLEENMWTAEIYAIEVDSSTICQCTGLKDKNGKLIWENDICRRVLLPTKRIKTNFKITYVPYKCCISAIDLDGSNITFLSDYINNQYEVEVIGNKFDNPELLEV